MLVLVYFGFCIWRCSWVGWLLGGAWDSDLFLGSFILLGQTGATINMISLFAYIVTLG